MGAGRSCQLSVSDNGMQPTGQDFAKNMQPARPAEATTHQLRIGELIVTHGKPTEVPLSLVPAFDAHHTSYRIDIPYDVHTLLVTPRNISILAGCTVRVFAKGAGGKHKIVAEVHAGYQYPPPAQPPAPSPTRAGDEESESDEGGDDDDESDHETPDGNEVTARARRKAETAQKVELPPPPTVESFLVDGFTVGDNIMVVHVEHPNATAITYNFLVVRAAWDKEGWKPGGARERFRWYLRGAQDGNPIAQYYLALMYAGEELDVIDWEKIDKQLEEKDREARERAKREIVLARQAQSAGAEHGDRNRDEGDVNDDDIEELDNDARPVVFTGPTAMNDDRSGDIQAENWGMEWQEDWLESTELIESLRATKDAARKEQYKEQMTLLHYKWLLASAKQKYVEALYRLANLYYTGHVPAHILENERRQEENLRSFSDSKLMSGTADNRQSDKAKKLSKYADSDFSKMQAAKWFEQAADQGDVRAAFQLGQMYVDGVGVPMDFKLSLHWFVDRAGVPEQIARQAIRRKFAALKPKYRKLFRYHDKDDDGKIDRKEFEQFYCAMWMATGLSQKQANSVTLGTWNGKQKSDVLYDAIGSGRKVSFEDIWSHPHTHTSLIPKKEEQLVRAEAFFNRWSQQVSIEMQAEEEDPEDDIFQRGDEKF